MKTQGTAGQPVALMSLAPRLSPGSAPVHYVVISGRPSNPEVPYTLTVTSRLLDLDEEAEPNHRPDNATSLRAGTETQGSMRATIGPGDTDMFALSESLEPATLDVTIDTPVGIDVAVEVSTGAGAILGTVDSGGMGAAESLAAISVGPSSIVLVEVVGKPSKKPVSSAAYRLRWSLDLAALPEPSPDSDPLPPEE
jgi:hypothetical protein